MISNHQYSGDQLFPKITEELNSINYFETDCSKPLRD